MNLRSEPSLKGRSWISCLEQFCFLLADRVYNFWSRMSNPSIFWMEKITKFQCTGFICSSSLLLKHKDKSNTKTFMISYFLRLLPGYWRQCLEKRFLYVLQERWMATLQNHTWGIRQTKWRNHIITRFCERIYRRTQNFSMDIKKLFFPGNKNYLKNR